jgi:hypothetical protein
MKLIFLMFDFLQTENIAMKETRMGKVGVDCKDKGGWR